MDVGEMLRSSLHGSFSTVTAMQVRLHFRAGVPWALVRCPMCADVDKHSVLEVARSTVRCKKCGHTMDVRERLADEAAKWPEVPPELVRLLSDADHATSAEMHR